MADENIASLKIPGALHKQLRIRAAEKGVRIQVLVEHLLERGLRQGKKRVDSSRGNV